MEAIELLFTAYFMNCKDERCAQDAFSIYEFVRASEEEITARLP